MVPLDQSQTPNLEIAHVLFLDIIAYSKLPMDEQQKVLRQLQESVRGTEEFARAQAKDELIRLPTGDGMALVFFTDPEAPVRCALELSHALRDHPEIPLRMGIHSGPVYRVADINANRNVAGGGINIAQRVMDCGDAGHILVSGAVAEVLGQLSTWSNLLHDLGEVEVKHGVRLHLSNLYTDAAGNPEVPLELRVAQKAEADKLSVSARRKIKLGAVVAGVVATLVIGGFIYTHRAHALTEKDTIVLADFANSTGDAVFDDTLKQALAVQLEQSPFLNILSDRKIDSTLRLMGRSPEQPLTGQIARELCQRVGSKAMLAGSIASLGSQYVIGLNAVNCATGDSLAKEQAQATGKEGVLKALDKAASSLRGKLGESLSSVQKFDTPIEQATTSSLEALKAYSLGHKISHAKGHTAALPFFKKAVELDPKFAEAYSRIASVYHNLGEPALSEEYARKAYELRSGVSERERLYIEAHYYDLATGELEKAAQVYAVWQQTYRRDALPYRNLSSIYSGLGRYDRCLEEAREALRLEPNNGVEYVNYGGALTSLNRLDEAEAVYKQAEDHKLESEGLLSNRYFLAFLKGDAGKMARLLSVAAGKPGAEDLLLASQADTEVWYGRLRKARELTRRAIESALHNDAKETAAGYQAEAALREAELGNREQARAHATAAVRLAPNRDVRLMSALALTRAGDVAAADKLASQLNKSYPQDKLVQSYWLSTIRAAIELDRKNPSKAIELLQVASSYELGDRGLLCPVYLRGYAYLMLHNGSAAAAEFQKFLNHRGVVGNFPLGALAHLGLGRAYALQGDTAKARTACQDFLALWKDADPDIPILKQAKAEYAKLK